MKVAAVLLLFMFSVKSVQAVPNELEVRLLNDKRKEMTAGATSNVLIMLVNNSDTLKEVKLKLIAPGNNWKQVQDYPSVFLEKKSSLSKIISLRIPENTKAGDYSIGLEVFENTGIQPSAKISLPIRVMPRYEIRIDKLKSPRYLFSGDTLSVKFLIRNSSNLDITADASIINNKKPDFRSFKIRMDSTIVVNVPVSVEKNLSFFTQQNVTMTCFIAGKPETEISSSYSFDVIPSNKVKFDGYNRFPIKVSGIFAASNRNEKEPYGTMYDIRGSGALGQKNNRKLEFHFRGPDRGGNPILGLNDEYYIRYSSKRTEILLGDNNFRLTDLTESSRSGQGIKLQYNFNKLSFGSFYHLPRYFPGIRQVYAVFTDLKFSQNVKFSAGYLNKTDTLNKAATLMTFSGYINPSRWLNTEFEVSNGQFDNRSAKAFRGGLNINFSAVNSHVSFIRADPGYPGYVSNSMYISSGLTINMKKKFSLSFNYDINRSNLALDTLYANAPFSKYINILACFKISPNNSFSLGVYQNSLEDQAKNPLFNYTKNAGRLILQNKFGRVNLNIQGEMGKVENLLGTKNGDMTDFYNGYFYNKYMISKSISISGFVNYQGGQQYLITGFHRFYYGGSLQSTIKKKTYISVDYQSNYELKEYFRERSLMSVQLHLQINRNHELELGSNYNLAKNSLNKKELSVQARYSWTMNAPLSKKKDVASFSGKVTGMGVGSIEGIIFNLNGNIAMTDKNGNFEFPAVKTGTYILAMDESSVGLDAIAGVPGPYRVTIEHGRKTKFDILLTKAARINGRLVIQEDDKAGRKGYYPVKEEIDKVIIEASNGTEVFRILNGSDGTFGFSDLRPGKWHIKIYPNGIPPGYQLENDQYNFDLTPGKEEKLDVIIHKKSREIKLQKMF